MSMWGKTNFMDSGSFVASYLSEFHDFTLLIILNIIIFVLMVILNMNQMTFINKNFYSSHSMEFIWTVLPGAVLVLVAIPSLVLLFMMEDTSHMNINVHHVIGAQWYWEYRPAEQFYLPSVEEYSYYTSNMWDLSMTNASNMFRLLDTTLTLYLPCNEPSSLLVSSNDVLHSWTVPSLGVKTDACPGRLSQISVYPSRVGKYYGNCSEICGAYHSMMPITVCVIPNFYDVIWTETNYN